ncbi:phosphate ABC transporter substrate-binding protein PstS [Tersicoccus sp. Bi-70]|uniref:phosphate ABC transporter substrate-binding protein PstS n=1 Tax=Tersicoccus sp. Bi-70 TaxID=1897634 RepID=UPI00097811F4|nr:phosphate ABC transporter substrate-binding protein PstS [Tersicoccus sp. Bi-70]OMH32395.1 phosphate ABC transporter substrate-binding protein PstS [Tersicoccus sp. Bi-70]
MKFVRVSQAAAVLAVGALALTACGSDNATGQAGGSSAAASGSSSAGASVSGTLTGSGSSAQNAAMDAWKAGFSSANSGATVQYSPDGSGAGRKAFIAGAVQFAGTDAAMKTDELESAKKQCTTGALDIPAYISPIAVAFNVPGVQDLNLAPDTIAKIFRGQIKNWNDAAIKADNPNAQLPDLAITAVHRSDDSGTTKNFTDYLNKASEKVWTDKSDGVWPSSLGGENAKGTQGVVKTVTDTKGAITYADESAIAGTLGKAKVKVGDAWVGISPEAAAKAVELSSVEDGRAEHDIALKLDRVPKDSSAYPVVLVSYHVVCSTYKDQKTVDLVKAFENYVVSEQGQKDAADSAGNAPLSSKLSEQAKAAVASIKVAS